MRGKEGGGSSGWPGLNPVPTLYLKPVTSGFVPVCFQSPVTNENHDSRAGLDSGFPRQLRILVGRKLFVEGEVLCTILCTNGPGGADFCLSEFSILLKRRSRLRRTPFPELAGELEEGPDFVTRQEPCVVLRVTLRPQVDKIPDCRCKVMFARKARGTTAVLSRRARRVDGARSRRIRIPNN